MDEEIISTTAEYQDTIKGGWNNSPLRDENIGKKLRDIIPYYQIPKLFSAPDFYGNNDEQEKAGMKSMIETGVFVGFKYKEDRNSSGMNMPEWRELLAEVKIECQQWK
jgi:hypothetical protein